MIGESGCREEGTGQGGMSVCWVLMPGLLSYAQQDAAVNIIQPTDVADTRQAVRSNVASSHLETYVVQRLTVRQRQ
jgi:hypothetical protein